MAKFDEIWEIGQALEQQQAKYGDLLQDNAKLQEAADSATAAEEAAALAKERQLAAETRCTEAEVRFLTDI